MNYELLFTRQADTALERIINYLSDRSPQGAIVWCERWEEVLREVRDSPLHYALAPSRKSLVVRFAKSSSKLVAVEDIAHCLPWLVEACTSSTCAALART